MTIHTVIIFIENLALEDIVFNDKPIIEEIIEEFKFNNKSGNTELYDSWVKFPALSINNPIIEEGKNIYDVSITNLSLLNSSVTKHVNLSDDLPNIFPTIFVHDNDSGFTHTSITRKYDIMNKYEEIENLTKHNEFLNECLNLPKDTVICLIKMVIS